MPRKNHLRGAKMIDGVEVATGSLIPAWYHTIPGNSKWFLSSCYVYLSNMYEPLKEALLLSLILWQFFFQFLFWSFFLSFWSFFFGHFCHFFYFLWFSWFWGFSWFSVIFSSLYVLSDFGNCSQFFADFCHLSHFEQFIGCKWFWWFFWWF